MVYSNDRIEKIFSGNFETGKCLEDRMIIHPDGSRSCIHWELVDQGYHLEELKEEKDLTDQELLVDAYRELELYEKRKNSK